jgi:hypothetical protein
LKPILHTLVHIGPLPKPLSFFPYLPSKMSRTWNITNVSSSAENIILLQGFREYGYIDLDRYILELRIAKMTLDEVKEEHPDLFGSSAEVYECSPEFSVTFINSKACYTIDITIQKYNALKFDAEMSARNKMPNAHILEAMNTLINKKYDEWSKLESKPFDEVVKELRIPELVRMHVKTHLAALSDF